MPSLSASPPRRRPATRSGWRDSIVFLLATALLALGLRCFVVMPRSIPSESMMPGLVVGDYLLVAKWPYGISRFSLPIAPSVPHGRLFGHAPARGDVVVFRAPPDDRADYIKRVIGLPGDRVALHDGRLWLDGVLVPRVRIADFVLPLAANTQCLTLPGVPDGRTIDAQGRDICRLPRYRETLPGGRSYEVIDQGRTPQDEMAERTVPAGHYFMLGDNRDMSEDSRFPATPGGGVGLVASENLEGRAVFTFFSTGGGGSWRTLGLSAVRPARIGRAIR